MDQERSRAALSGFLNRFPVLQAETQIPLQRFSGFANARGTYDKTHAVRQLKTRQRFFQLGTIVTFDTARNTAGAGVIRHQYQITTRQTDKGGQRGAFITPFFFINLNNDFLTLAQNVLNVRAAMRAVIGWEVFAGNFFEGRKP